VKRMPFPVVVGDRASNEQNPFPVLPPRANTAWASTLAKDAKDAIDPGPPIPVRSRFTDELIEDFLDDVEDDRDMPRPVKNMAKNYLFGAMAYCVCDIPVDEPELFDVMRDRFWNRKGDACKLYPSKSADTATSTPSKPATSK